MADAERLRRLFEEPGLRWVVERLETRLRRGRPLAGSIGRRHPSDEERRAVERLLGRPPGRGRSLTLRLGDLEERLRHAGLARDLAEAADVLVGKVENRKARRRAERRHLRRLLDDAAKRDPRPAVGEWLAMRRTWVLLRRWERGEGEAERLLHQALEVLEGLPAGAPHRPLLQQLAVETTGDAHALDPGHRLGTLVIAAVAALGGQDPADGTWRDASGWRRAWEAVGILTDDLSAPVLVHGFRGNDESPLGRLLRIHHETGEPARLSLRQLRRHSDRHSNCRKGDLHRLLEQSPPKIAYVCENPAVVLAAAERLGVPAQPLICLEGQPATAARHLLDALARAGVRLRYHGDFDWTGLQIANLVMERHGAEPWRYGSADYERAAGCPPRGPELLGEPVEASWDPRLASVMVEHGRAVHEEAVLGELLSDLAGG